MWRGNYLLHGRRHKQASKQVWNYCNERADKEGIVVAEESRTACCHCCTYLLLIRI